MQIRNFYEELKGKMEYAEMPTYAGNELLKFMTAKAKEMDAPVDKIADAVTKYIEFVKANADNHSHALRSFALILGYVSEPRYFREGCRMLSANEMA